MLNLEYYLKKIIEENAISEVIREEGLYEDVTDIQLKSFFSWRIMKLTDCLAT